MVLALSLALLLVAGFLILTWNGLTRLRQLARNAWADIDVQLRRRHDLVPNLVRVVEGHAGYERGTALGAGSVTERSAAETQVTHQMKHLLALVEQYPELRANENVLRLQQQLTETENDIASARRYYNAVVRDLNIMRETFPNVLVATMLGFREGEYFKVDEDERALPGAQLQ